MPERVFVERTQIDRRVDDKYLRQLLTEYRDDWADRVIGEGGMGWDDLVLIARRLLEISYPESIIPDQLVAGRTVRRPGREVPLEERDVGAQFVVHLRRALAVLPE